MDEKKRYTENTEGHRDHGVRKKLRSMLRHYKCKRNPRLLVQVGDFLV
jgi:hypothetical protein